MGREELCFVIVDAPWVVKIQSYRALLCTFVVLREGCAVLTNESPTSMWRLFIKNSTTPTRERRQYNRRNSYSIGSKTMRSVSYTAVLFWNLESWRSWRVQLQSRKTWRFHRSRTFELATEYRCLRSRLSIGHFQHRQNFALSSLSFWIFDILEATTFDACVCVCDFSACVFSRVLSLRAALSAASNADSRLCPAQASLRRFYSSIAICTVLHIFWKTVLWRRIFLSLNNWKN